MSHYKPNSPLSRINREAAQHPVAVEPELFDFIADAMRYHRDSDGAFDITVGPLMKAWGFFRGEGRVPSDDELAAARASRRRRPCDAESGVEDDRASIEPGVELDLGGIAKGYAVDRVVGLLRRRRIAAALVSAGGSTIYGLGAPPGRGGMGRHDPGSDRSSKNRAHRSTEGPRALGGRQLREVVRGRRRHVFAHHGPAHRQAGAGSAERRGAGGQRNGRRCARQRVLRAGLERQPAYATWRGVFRPREGDSDAACRGRRPKRMEARCDSGTDGLSRRGFASGGLTSPRGRDRRTA